MYYIYEYMTLVGGISIDRIEENEVKAHWPSIRHRASSSLCIGMSRFAWSKQ